VDQLTAALGTSADTVAAINSLELGLFSSVLAPDVAILSATIDHNVTAALSCNSSNVYAYSVTLQVAVLTADMLLSVFVNVLNSTYTRQSTTALLRAKPIPHCPVLLCKTGSQHALCQCYYTYGDLLFMLVCMGPASVHYSTAQGKMHSPLSSAALQNRLTLCIMSVQLCQWRFVVHAGVK